MRSVGTTVEAGLSVQADLAANVYGFAEARRGLGGHDGWNGQAGVDCLLRGRDNWLISIGPRISWGNGRHHRSCFGITPNEASVTGLTAYAADSPVTSAFGSRHQLSGGIGLSYSFTRTRRD